MLGSQATDCHSVTAPGRAGANPTLLELTPLLTWTSNVTSFPTPQQTGEVTVEEPSQPSRSWRVMTQESQLWVLGGPE